MASASHEWNAKRMIEFGENSIIGGGWSRLVVHRADDWASMSVDRRVLRPGIMPLRLPFLAPLCAIIVSVGASGASAEGRSLAFRLDISRTHHSDHDTILVVSTARNAGHSALSAWGLFDYRGGYKPSAETFERWRAIR